MKEIRIFLKTDETEVEKCIEILDAVLIGLFNTEDIVIDVEEVKE